MNKIHPSNGEIKIRHGFRRITQTNWLTPDVPRMCPMMTAGEWLCILLAPQLEPGAPAEISMLLEVARGSLIYGWHFSRSLPLPLNNSIVSLKPP